MEQLKIEVNKKVNGKYSKVGEVGIYVPTFADLDLDIKLAVDKEGNPMVEEGLPVYADDRFNWVQGAILASVKAQARNKLVPSTADVKAGQKIASNWDELTAEGERIGNPDALAAIREAKADFAEWVKTLGKSANAQVTLNTFFSNKAALSLQPEGQRAKMAAYVTEFAGKLDETKLARYMKYLDSVNAACEVVTEVDDF